jgi:hypothetical protein
LSHGPLVSVVLPVYNGVFCLKEAIQSILDQTYTHFEIIVIDDGSTDNSADIVLTFVDPRVRLFSQKNQGLAATLNKGITLAEGAYVARQDQDDVSLPNRFSRQIEFLSANPDYGMVGTWASIWDGKKPTNRAHRHPTDDLTLKFSLLFDNPFVHSSMMIRRAILEEVGGYCTDVNRQPPEDYELWSRIARKSKVANIPEILHVYREIPQSMSRNGNNPFLKHLLKINTENLAAVTGEAYTWQSYQDLAALVHGEYQHYSGKTSIGELVSIVENAARGLSLVSGVGYDEVQSCINSVRYHFFQARCLRLLGVSGRNILNRIAGMCRGLIRH